MKSGAGVAWLVLPLPGLAQSVKGRAGRQSRGVGPPSTWLLEGGVTYRKVGSWADWDTVGVDPPPHRSAELLRVLGAAAGVMTEGDAERSSPHRLPGRPLLPLGLGGGGVGAASSSRKPSLTALGWAIASLELLWPLGPLCTLGKGVLSSEYFRALRWGALSTALHPAYGLGLRGRPTAPRRRNSPGAEGDQAQGLCLEAWAAWTRKAVSLFPGWQTGIILLSSHVEASFPPPQTSPKEPPPCPHPRAGNALGSEGQGWPSTGVSWASWRLGSWSPRQPRGPPSRRVTPSHSGLTLPAFTEGLAGGEWATPGPGPLKTADSYPMELNLSPPSLNYPGGRCGPSSPLSSPGASFSNLRGWTAASLGVRLVSPTPADLPRGPRALGGHGWTG